MLGQSTAFLEQSPRREIQQRFGSLNIHARQKWSVVTAALADLGKGPVQMLDAGCGDGSWTLEIALRQPNWSVVGLDRDTKAIGTAIEKQKRVGCNNARFVQSDFRAFHSDARFDAILSVASAHYMVMANQGEELFGSFHRWLRKSGKLILLAPRRAAETPFVKWLPRPKAQPVFSRRQLEDLCRGAGFQIESLDPVGTRAMAVAKQLALLQDRSPLSAITYPVQLALTAIDERRNPPADSSVFWMLRARV